MESVLPAPARAVVRNARPRTPRTGRDLVAASRLRGCAAHQGTCWLRPIERRLDRFAPGVARGYRALGLPGSVDLGIVAREERVIRLEIGLAAGTAAGESIARLYAAPYDVPLETVSEAGRLRGVAAEVRDRDATADPDGPKGEGRAYWPEVALLLRDSYRSPSNAVRNWAVGGRRPTIQQAGGTSAAGPRVPGC